ncbi:MAG: MoxR family ATPase [Verrucomicrobia bacterium]|nr:MoxR family ATPase [Verrucomicrobiota bacterium]MDA1087490.1 MoxR family ATPase [Verrucomicrobiota bacterium]
MSGTALEQHKVTSAGVPGDDASMDGVHVDVQRLRDAVATQIYGKDVPILRVIATLIGEGHLLIEDVPGVGKTSMAVAVAGAIGGSFHRIQFTSDLLPSDVIGVPIYLQSEDRFQFKRGPVFANVVLADEINRTTPKTQSAMLEAMQDARVSIDGEVHDLPAPFMVIATQNPIEHHGTYALPESQLDRFMMRIRIGYPAPEFEGDILRAQDELRYGAGPELAVSLERLIEIQRCVPAVRVDDDLVRYILSIAQATRSHDEIELGVSTRGAQMMYRALQAWALCNGRTYVVPDDVKDLIHPVFDHRLILRSSYHSTLTHSDAEDAASVLLDRITEEIEVPS